MRKTMLRLGSGLALLSVALGAFASHGLTSLIDPEQLRTFEIGVRYQFYHALAILVIGVLLHFGKKRFLLFAGWLFLVGIVFFSGSLYLLSLRDLLFFDAAILGPITPIGGTLFIAGWAFLFLSTYQHSAKTRPKQ